MADDFVTRAQYDELVDVVENLVEEMTAVRERNAELERVASSTQEELAAAKEELAATREEMAERSREVEDRLRSNVGNLAVAVQRMVQHTITSVEAIEECMEMYDLAGGTGGDGGDHVYSAGGFTFTSSAQVYSSSCPEHQARNMFDYSTDRYFCTTTTGGGTDTLHVSIPNDQPVDAIVFKVCRLCHVRIEADGATVFDQGVQDSGVYSIKVARPTDVVMFLRTHSSYYVSLYELKLFHWSENLETLAGYALGERDVPSSSS